MPFVWSDPRTDYSAAAAEQVGAADMNRIGVNMLYLKGDAQWQTPSFINSWHNFDGAHSPAGFKRAGDLVYLRGLITGGLRNTDVFLLPAGYTPVGYTLLFCPVVGVPGALIAAPDLQRVDVEADGTVHCMYQPISSSDYVSLDGIVFYAV